MGQEKRVGDQMCEPEDRALHHHQRFLVHHQALELDSPVCQARLPRQLDKDSRLFCRLLAVTVADPVMVTVADLVVVTVGDPVVVTVGDLVVVAVGDPLVVTVADLVVVAVGDQLVVTVADQLVVAVGDQLVVADLLLVMQVGRLVRVHTCQVCSYTRPTTLIRAGTSTPRPG